MSSREYFINMYEILFHSLPDNETIYFYTDLFNNKGFSDFNIIQYIIYQPSYILHLLNLISSNYKPWLSISNLEQQLQSVSNLFEQNCKEIQRLHTSKLSSQITPINHFISYYSQINPPNDNNPFIYVFLCCRDNENSLSNTLNNLISIQNKCTQFNFYYHIFENDSTDNTKKIIIDFFNNKNIHGNYSLNNFHFKKWNSIEDINRSKDMAFYRNSMKNLCEFNLNSDFSLILDTDISFTEQTFVHMLNVLTVHKSIHMVTPFAFVDENTAYYDTYALQTLEDKNFISLLIPELLEVKSAFGGFALLRTSSLQQCNWSHNNEIICSEHNNFCNELRQFGKIVIARDIRVNWLNS